MLEFDIQELLSTQGGITIFSAAIILFFVGLMIGQIKAAIVKSKFNKLKRESFIPLRSSYEALQRDHLQLEEDANKFKQSSTEAKDELKLMKEALELYKLKAEEEKTKLKTSLETKIKDIDVNKETQFSNKDKELALWAEKYNALNSELTSFKAHENQKILDLENENGKLQNELDKFNAHLGDDSSSNKGWKVKYDVLLEEFDQYKKNAEDNRQDWANRYTLLQEEYQDFKVSVLKGTENENTKESPDSNSIENEQPSQTVTYQNKEEKTEDIDKEVSLAEETSPIESKAEEIADEVAESVESVTEEDGSEETKATEEETISSDVPEVEASNITEEAVLWQQKYESLEKDFLTFKSQIEEKFEQSKNEQKPAELAQPNIEELKSLIKEVGQEMTSQKLSDTEKAYLATYEVNKEQAQVEDNSDDLKNKKDSNQGENSADTIFKSHYFGTK